MVRLKKNLSRENNVRRTVTQSDDLSTELAKQRVKYKSYTLDKYTHLEVCESCILNMNLSSSLIILRLLPITLESSLENLSRPSAISATRQTIRSFIISSLDLTLDSLRACLLFSLLRLAIDNFSTVKEEEVNI